MSKIRSFIGKFFSRVKFSITIKLPLINVTLAPSLSMQPSMKAAFFIFLALL